MAEAHVARLSTHSSHRVLEPTRAARLHDAIVDGLGSPDTILRVSYTTQLLTTRRN